MMKQFHISGIKGILHKIALSGHVCSDREIQIGWMVPTPSAWGNYGCPIDLTGLSWNINEQTPVVNIFQCALCGSRRHEHIGMSVDSA